MGTRPSNTRSLNTRCRSPSDSEPAKCSCTSASTTRSTPLLRRHRCGSTRHRNIEGYPMAPHRRSHIRHGNDRPDRQRPLDLRPDGELRSVPRSGNRRDHHTLHGIGERAAPSSSQAEECSTRRRTGRRRKRRLTKSAPRHLKKRVQMIQMMPPRTPRTPAAMNGGGCGRHPTGIRPRFGTPSSLS